YPTEGLPALVAPRWVDPNTGTVTVADKHFGQDVRPCNDDAEVAFAHKTGFTYNFLADMGIVDSLPDTPADRHYIVVMMSNLGYRYADGRFARAQHAPCVDPGVCYTERFARLGRAIDDLPV